MMEGSAATVSDSDCDQTTCTFLGTTALDGLQDTAYVRYLDSIQKGLWLYVSPVLILTGVLGNSLSICTLRTKEFRGSVPAVLMMIMAVTDIVVLLTGPLITWVEKIIGRYPGHDNSAFCKIHEFLLYLVMQLSPWTLVLITIERTISVVDPLRALTLLSRKKMAAAWLVVVAILVPINGYLLVLKDVRETTENGTNITSLICTFDKRHKDLVQKYKYWSDIFISCLMPCSLILICNAAISFTLAKRKRNASHGHGVPAFGSVTRMLVVVSLVFMLTSLPVGIYFIKYEEWFLGYKTNLLIKTQMKVTFASVMLLSYIGNAFNFALYFATGVKFRSAFAGMLCLQSAGRCTSERARSGSLPSRISSGTAINNVESLPLAPVSPRETSSTGTSNQRWL